MFLLLAAILLAQEPSLDQLIERLRSDTVEEREAASKELRRRGAAARIPLEKESRSGDPEAAQRAHDLLDLLLDDEANTDLRAVFQNLARPLPLKLRIEGGLEGTGDNGALTAECLRGGGNKLRAKFIFTKSAVPDQVSYHSDGELIAWWRGSDPADSACLKTPPDLDGRLDQAFALAGAVGILFHLQKVFQHPGTSRDPNLWTPPETSNVHRRDSDDSHRLLTYSLNRLGADSEYSAKVLLWYDPEKKLPVKRRFSLRKDDSEEFVVLTETYLEISRNPVLGDDLFQLPEGAGGDARIQLAQAGLLDLRNALERYRGDTGAWPTTEQGLDALLRRPEGLKGWSGPYLPAAPVPKDPWKTPYRYQLPGTINPKGYDLYSAGPDRKQNTADDIGS